MFKYSIVLLFCFIIAANVFGVPRLVNYQGKVTDTNGVGIDDTLEIIISIYDDSTGGTALWIEQHLEVPVTKGLFDIILGTEDPLDLLFEGGEYWLQISVDRDVLSPRQRIISEIFAIRAIYADTANLVRWNDIIGVDPLIIMEGENVSLLANDAGYLTDVDWDTLGAYSDTFHGHSFLDISGSATDGQIPNDISIDYSDSTGAVKWSDIFGIPSRIMMEGENVSLLANDAGYLTDVDWDTIGAYSDTFHGHSFLDISGSATDAQIPNDISIDYSDSTGAVT
ncbi:hypothetical protein JXI42_07710, partial [bacterium]|nr:hypothetical protein [bacterium]